MASQLQQQQRRNAAKSPPPAAEKPQQRINPEINEKLDAFIAQNPKTYDHFMAMPKEQLVRKHMLRLMWKEQKQARGFDQLMEYAKQDPKLKAQVDRALANEQHPLIKRQQIAARIINAHAAKTQIGARLGAG